MKYHFKIHKEGKGFWAQCIEIPGCLTQGSSKEELFSNMQEALNIFIEEPVDATCVAPFPDTTIKVSSNVVEVALSPEIAFSFLVRSCRLKKGLTQKEAAQHVGMKNIFSYQRLEKRCNPTLEVMQKLKHIFPELSVDRVFT